MNESDFEGYDSHRVIMKILNSDLPFPQSNTSLNVPSNKTRIGKSSGEELCCELRIL